MAGLLKEKRTFLKLSFYFVAKFQRPLSSRGRGGKALMARSLREELFLRLPNRGKSFFLNGSAIKRGGGSWGKGLAIKKKGKNWPATHECIRTKLYQHLFFR